MVLHTISIILRLTKTHNKALKRIFDLQVGVYLKNADVLKTVSRNRCKHWAQQGVTLLKALHLYVKKQT